MSFYCQTHSWNHLYSPCPLCPNLSVTTTGGGTVPISISFSENTANYLNVISDLNHKLDIAKKALEFYALLPGEVLRSDDLFMRTPLNELAKQALEELEK